MSATEEYLRGIQQELARDALARPQEVADEVVIQLTDVQLAFGDLVVLDGVTLAVRRGETLMIAGESGSGKSTILKLILRLLRPDGGEIRVFDEDVAHLTFAEALDLRRQIGMVFQNAALFDSMTIYENVAYPLRENTDLAEDEIEHTVRERLQFVDLDPDQIMAQLPSQLSGGMRKRVGIARAIATSPRVILYDEPTSGLDPLTVGTFNRLMRKLQRELHVTSVLVTHDIREGFRVANRVALLREGRIVFEGTPEEMVAAQDSYITAFLS